MIHMHLDILMVVCEPLVKFSSRVHNNENVQDLETIHKTLPEAKLQHKPLLQIKKDSDH
jgi:hypothetical protein